MLPLPDFVSKILVKRISGSRHGFPFCEGSCETSLTSCQNQGNQSDRPSREVLGEEEVWTFLFPSKRMPSKLDIHPLSLSFSCESSHEFRGKPKECNF